MDPLVSAEYDDGEDELTDMAIRYFQPSFLDVRSNLLASCDLMNPTIRFTQHAWTKG